MQHQPIFDPDAFCACLSSASLQSMDQAFPEWRSAIRDAAFQHWLQCQPHATRMLCIDPQRALDGLKALQLYFSSEFSAAHRGG